MANLDYSEYSVSVISEWQYKGDSVNGSGNVGGLSWSSQKFLYSKVGKDSNINYTYVIKCHTHYDIQDPTITIWNAGTDNTNSSCYLGAKFVSCDKNSTPSAKYINEKIEGDTKLRFGKAWLGDDWNTAGDGNAISGAAIGKTKKDFTIKAGYFFVYLAIHNDCTYENHSTIRVVSLAGEQGELNEHKGMLICPDALRSVDKYWVSYSAGTGTGVMHDQVKYKDVPLRLTPVGFTPSGDSVKIEVTLKTNDGTDDNFKVLSGFRGQQFTHWSDINNNTFVNEGWYDENADITLTANWSLDPQSPAFILGAPERKTEKVPFQITAKLNEDFYIQYPLSRDTSYEFEYWTKNQTATAGEATYDSTKSHTFSESTVLYAQYDSSTDITDFSLPSALVMEDFILKGWSREPNGSLIDISSYHPEENDILYAVWEDPTVVEEGMYIYHNNKWCRVINFNA